MASPPASSSGPGQAVGVVLATHDGPRLAEWYRALRAPLGAQLSCALGGTTGVGGSVFSVMPADGDLPAAPKSDVGEEPYGQRRSTLNRRIDDLDKVLDRLGGRGDAVAGPRDYGYGRFAWVHDPDGTVVEYWEVGSPP